MVDVSRGDIVTRGGLSFVVWVHGQGEIQAMPVISGMADFTRLVTMRRDSAVATGERFTAVDALKVCRANFLRIKDDGGIHSDGWETHNDPHQAYFNDGRYHAPIYGSEGGYWVQPTRSAT